MRVIFLSIFLLFQCLYVVSQVSNRIKLQEIYDSIKSKGILFPDIVMGQCIQETGWMKCNNCCFNYNNLFGFYIKGNKCLKFSSQMDCILYYKSWQDKRYPKWKKSHPRNDYYTFLTDIHYATGEKYNNEVRQKVDWVRKNLKL